MNIIKVKSKDAVTTIQDFIYNEKYGCAYCVHDEKSVFTTQTNIIDKELCTKLGYNVLETMHTGGVVVVSEGDISVVHFGNIGNDFMLRFALHLVEYYKTKGLNAYFDGNDILIDGYKISGLSATPYGYIQYSTIHIGINTNLNDIKAICTKQMTKVPKGLSDYSITTSEIEEMFIDFCRSADESVDKEEDT